MKWIRYSLRTVSDAADIIAASLYDIGIEGVEIEENRPPSKEDLEQMFEDFIPEYDGSDNTAVVHFYLEPGPETEGMVAKVSEMIEDLRRTADIGEGTVTVSETEDVDWINSWKQYFHKFTVDGDILIIPSWEEEEDTGRYSLVLHIDPGTAFGTGMHETTRLAIRQLRKYLKPKDAVLDIGTGSGILGITALKSGASFVKGVDIDPNAVNAVNDNLVSNEIEGAAFEMLIGNLITDDGFMEPSDLEKYDIVTANILADVLTAIAPKAGKYMKDGALIVTSGILENKTSEVMDAFAANGFKPVETISEGEWVSVTFRKKEA